MTQPDRRPWLGPAAVTLLAFAGVFKGSPALAWLPIDLTVLTAALVAALVAGRLLRDRGATRVTAGAVLAVVAVLPGFFTPALNPYATQARIGLALVALTLVGALLLVDTEQRQRAWVWAQVAVGLVLVVLGQFEPASTVDRFSLDGGSTIAAGRASGVAAVVLLTLLLTGALRRPWQVVLALGAAAAATGTMLATGSRGPVAAAATSILLVMLVAGGRGRLVRLVLSFAAVYAGAVMLNASTGAGAERLQLALSGRLDNTATRRPLWEQAFALIPSHPLGIGWGNFFNSISSGLQAGGYRVYPHNVVLEAAAEGGWLAGVALVLFIGAGLYRLARNAATPYGAALLAIAVFFVLNSLVSGSIADNRMMFAAVAVGFVRRAMPAGPSPAGRPAPRCDAAPDPQRTLAGSRRPLAGR